MKPAKKFNVVADAGYRVLSVVVEAADFDSAYAAAMPDLQRRAEGKPVRNVRIVPLF